MDSIVTTAIVGTGQAGNQGITTHTPIDTLAAQLTCEPERQLLLTAGAWAIYRRAGAVPASAPAASAPAEPESLAGCSSKTAQLMNTLLVGEYRALLPEALARMQSAGLRLPYNLLPQALEYGSQTKEARAALVSALGTRGRWLSQFNTTWSWVAQYLAETTQTLPDDAETIWQEGTQGQRYEILQRLRQTDPTRAREWLIAGWKQEKADTRNDFLTTFETNLSLDDEPLLEQALDDRSSKVCTTAARLLSRLPGSALAQRMRTRADTMLSYDGNELIAVLPEEINQEWKRDGIAEDTSNDKGKRTAWMTQVLAQIPLQHWEARFGVGPRQLLDAAVRTEWTLEIIESWSYAALLHQNDNWIAPLFDWWHGLQPASQQTPSSAKAKSQSHFSSNDKERLLSLLPQKEAEQRVLLLKDDAGAWQSAATALPRPWSEAFGHQCLQIMRDYLRRMTKNSSYGYGWETFLQTIMLALPPSCFSSALETWELADDMQEWAKSHWKKNLSAFEIQIGIRKHILEEIK